MNRLSRFLFSRKKAGRKILSLFLTCGFPDSRTTVPLVASLAEAGADLIELGIPFSDPIADGATIQRSSEVALKGGMTLEKTLNTAREIRARTAIPLVLMGYSNPVFAFGFPAFFNACRDIGIEGTILPDLPLEECDEYLRLAKKSGVAAILLASPTTPDERVKKIDLASSGFLYGVSIAGVTGERRGIPPESESFFRRLGRLVRKNPVLAGFGISDAASARRMACLCDGVIIGSALVRKLDDASARVGLKAAVDFVRTVRTALDSE